jgi:DNA repair protein RadC
MVANPLLDPILEIPPDELPSEKLCSRGPNALSNSELIAVLLRSSFRGAPPLLLARQLLSEFGSLQGLSRACIPQVARIRGVGRSRAVLLAAAFHLGSRLALESTNRQRIDTPEAVWALLGSEMRSLQRECLRVLLLDTKHHLLRMEEVSVGSLNESIAHPREILRPALLHPAYALLVVHNHPSGDPQPSTADLQFTRRLSEAAALLQIQFLDHIILGSSDNERRPWFSFKKAGLL